MPFTFSHPAAVLPFGFLPRKLSSLTGLVIGSMVPDFEKFLKMEGGNSYSHTWAGVFWFCLPLGIALSFLYHLIVRDPLIDNLPGFLRRRLAGFKQLDWKLYFRKHYLIVIFSIIIGAVTHLVWDDFTHKNVAYERQYPIMAGAVELYGFKVPVFAFLNWLSSAVGLIVVLYAILRLPKEDSASKRTYHTKAFWPVVIVVAVAVIGVRLISGLSLNDGVLRLEQEFWDLVITVVSAGLISLAVSPFILRKAVSK